MKPLYIIGLAFLASCTQLGQRVAYGPNYRQIVNAPREAIQTVETTKQELGQLKKEAKQLVQATPEPARTQKEVISTEAETKQANKDAREAKYASYELQDRLQAMTDSVSQYRFRLRMNKIDYDIEKDGLNRRIMNLERTLTSIQGDKTALANKISEKEHLIDSLRHRNEVLTSDLIRTADALDHVGNKPHKATIINLGSASVVGTENPALTHSRSTYVPTHLYSSRAAPVRRSSQVYHLGPKGGCYYYTGSGRKEYVDRNLCH